MPGDNASRSPSQPCGRWWLALSIRWPRSQPLAPAGYSSRGGVARQPAIRQLSAPSHTGPNSHRGTHEMNWQHPRGRSTRRRCPLARSCPVHPGGVLVGHQVGAIEPVGVGRGHGSQEVRALLVPDPAGADVEDGAAASAGRVGTGQANPKQRPIQQSWTVQEPTQRFLTH